ncbi:MAG: monovalent cation/H(+) antiporter subunit G [Spirochaetia bacterium]|jgi:multicomponent Na+:H+ antiporter subunit G|nr:monovalent cation/H(+) antiporter subunit G [Spirochaetia bacterium]
MTYWIVYVFLILGAVFNLMGLLGVLIFPDPYTRLQASSTCSTTSVISIFIAAMVDAGFSPVTGKILVITLFFFISSPVSAHIIACYAWNNEIIPWRRKGRAQ